MRCRRGGLDNESVNAIDIQIAERDALRRGLAGSAQNDAVTQRTCGRREPGVRELVPDIAIGARARREDRPRLRGELLESPRP